MKVEIVKSALMAFNAPLPTLTFMTAHVRARQEKKSNGKAVKPVIKEK